MDEPSRPSALRDFPVVFRAPIQWADLDAYGHVNNLVYLRWFEAARAIYATRVGVEVLPKPTGVGALVGAISCKYHRQLSYPGEIFSGVRITRIAVAGVTLESRIVEAALGVTVADGQCEVVLVDYATGQPIPVPDHIRAAVEALEGREFPASG